MIFHNSASHRHRPAILSILCAILPAALLEDAVRWRAVSPEPPYRTSSSVEVGNEACRPCHEAIYNSYSRTAMARTSGPAVPDLEGSFKHARSGVSYRVFRDGQTAVLSVQARWTDGARRQTSTEVRTLVRTPADVRFCLTSMVFSTRHQSITTRRRTLGTYRRATHSSVRWS